MTLGLLHLQQIMLIAKVAQSASLYNNYTATNACPYKHFVKVEGAPVAENCTSDHSGMLLATVFVYPGLLLTH